jgi:uncharacterized integral membrane protein
MAVILYFASLNLRETVTLRLWVGESHIYENVPLVVSLFGAYLLGIITYFIIALARDIRLRTQITRLRRENRSLMAELHQLRGSALDDLPSAEVSEGTVQGEIPR